MSLVRYIDYEKTTRYSPFIKHDIYIWDWKNVLCNPNLKMMLVEKRLSTQSNSPSGVYYLSQNPNITWEFIQKHRDLEWNYSALLNNPNFTWEIIQDNLNVWYDNLLDAVTEFKSHYRYHTTATIC